jgi:hypothetical protein
VGGRLRIKIPDHHAKVILIKKVGRDLSARNLAKYGVFHSI